MKTLVAIGCSHTKGAELYNGLAHHLENENLSFAKSLADKLGYNYINLSLNGGSNDYIFRTTVEFFTQNINHINDYAFLIGWSSCNRLELHYHDDEDLSTYSLSSTPVLDKKYIPVVAGMNTKNLQSNRWESLVANYVDLLINQTQGSEKLANYAYVLQNLFEKHNVNYLMFNTINEIFTTPSNEATIKLLNTETYIEPFEHNFAFFWYCKNILGYQDVTAYGHHKKPAHDDWAEYLYSKITLSNKDWLSEK